MNYTDLKKTFRSAPLIVSRDLPAAKGDRQGLRNQLGRWKARGLVIQLRRGLYMLNKDDRRVEPSRAFIANQLYGPSYVSLQYALYYYDMVPEQVVTMTSVTTRKTKVFHNTLGAFSYQHLKPGVFRGFRVRKDESGLPFLIADPEKALIDFIYLNLSLFKPSDMDIFEESYRFQNMEAVSLAGIRKAASYFRNSKLARVAENLCRWLKKGGGR